MGRMPRSVPAIALLLPALFAAVLEKLTLCRATNEKNRKHTWLRAPKPTSSKVNRTRSRQTNPQTHGTPTDRRREPHKTYPGTLKTQPYHVPKLSFGRAPMRRNNGKPMMSNPPSVSKLFTRIRCTRSSRGAFPRTTQPHSQAHAPRNRFVPRLTNTMRVRRRKCRRYKSQASRKRLRRKHFRADATFPSTS